MANRTILETSMSRVAADIDTSIAPLPIIIFGDADQNAYSGPFFALTALTNATLDVDQCSMGDDMKTRTGANTLGTNTTNFVIPKGVTIYGEFNSIELDSGTLIAYSRPGTTVTVLS
tara:strand:- start:9218 stop:9568 length:351 start_codon:yes stop_codon:yes gene_type:complete